MREIKFRVFSSEVRRFEHFPLNNITISDRLLSQHSYPVQQFTGLKDKNGKEIYEGDIVSTIYIDDHPTGEVLFDNDLGSFRIKVKDALLPIVTFRFVDGIPHGLLPVVDSVLGNIFEQLK